MARIQVFGGPHGIVGAPHLEQRADVDLDARPTRSAHTKEFFEHRQRFTRTVQAREAHRPAQHRVGVLTVGREDASELPECDAMTAQHHVAPGDARPLRRVEALRGGGVDDAQCFRGAARADERRHELLGYGALELRIGLETAPQRVQRRVVFVAVEQEEALQIAGPGCFVRARVDDVLQCLGRLREFRPRQFLFDVIRREHVRVGEAHGFLGAGRDERRDIRCRTRTRERHPGAVAPPKHQRQRIAIARDFPDDVLVREVQQLPEIARQGLDRQLADGNLDVGLQRGGDVAAPRLLRVRDALDRVDRVQQPLGDDGGRIPAIDQLARDFDRVKHDGVAAKLAPKRIEQRRKQADQHDRQQDREHRRDILREPRQEVLLGAVGAEAE